MRDLSSSMSGKFSHSSMNNINNPIIHNTTSLADYDNTTCTSKHCCVYMKIHVPSMPAKGVETIKVQTQQTSSHNGLVNS